MSGKNKNTSKPTIEISSKTGGSQNYSKKGENVTNTTVKPPVKKPIK